MNAFYKVQADERQAIIDGELDAQQSTSGGTSTDAPEPLSDASPSTEGVRVLSEEEAAKYRLPPDKIKEALSEVTLGDARQVWADQWRGKTSALGIFETPGEFAQQNGSPDVNRPEHGLPEVNRRLFDILSQTANQDIMEIETGGARGDNEFVPERLRNLVQQEDRSGSPSIHTAVIQLGSYANCFVIADETMDTLYVNFQLCNVPDHRQDLDLDKGTYSLLCQLAPATWGKRQGGENMVSLAFCALDDQSVFKIIYTMNYMASTYLKWGGDQCGASLSGQQGGARVPIDTIMTTREPNRLGRIAESIVEDPKAISKTVSEQGIGALKRNKQPLSEETAWADDFRVAACTLQAVANSLRLVPDDDDQKKQTAKTRARQRLTEAEKTFVEAAAKFIEKSKEADRQGPWRQWARELVGWINGDVACWPMETGRNEFSARGFAEPPGGELIPNPDVPDPDDDEKEKQEADADEDGLSDDAGLVRGSDGPGPPAPDPELSSDGSAELGLSDDAGLVPDPELSDVAAPDPELSSDGSAEASGDTGLPPRPPSRPPAQDADGPGLPAPDPELSSDDSTAASDDAGDRGDAPNLPVREQLGHEMRGIRDGRQPAEETPDEKERREAAQRISEEEAKRGQGQSELQSFIALVEDQASEVQEMALKPSTTSKQRKDEFDKALRNVTEGLESKLSVLLNNARTVGVDEEKRQVEADMLARDLREAAARRNPERDPKVPDSVGPEVEEVRTETGQEGGAGEEIMEEIEGLPDSQHNAKEMARKMQSAFQAFERYGEALGADSVTDDQIETAYGVLTKNLDSLLGSTEPDAPEQPAAPVSETDPADGCREVDPNQDDMGDPEVVAKRKVYVTGYSVGGALASLFTLYYSEIKYASPEACGVIPYIPANILPPTTILATYGAPPCGTNHRNAWDMQSVNRKMQNYIDGGAVVMRRYVTQGDPIPRLVPDDTGRRIGYTHMGNCCGTSVVRCPGTLNIFDGFFETLSNGIAGIASQQMKRGFQLFSTKKYDFQNNEIDEYGCRSWFIDKVDDPSRLKKPEQHADQCGIRFFIPLLALHLGASDGIARERSEEMGPRPIARRQADCSIYLPYVTPGSDGAAGGTIRRLPLYSGDSPSPGNYCDFMVAATAAPDVQSADMDRVINTKYYDVLRSWGNMDKTGMAELKTKIANAVWGGPMGSVSSGYRYESVYGAVLATINFDQVQGCAYVQAPKGWSGESELAPGESVAVAPSTTPAQVKAQKTESRRLGTVGGVKRRTRDKRKKRGRRTRRT